MEVVDNMKLGKLVKDHGIRSGVAGGWNEVRVRWHAGVGNIVRGTTKNLFATSGLMRGWRGVQLVSMLAMFVLPCVALPFFRGWALVADAIAVSAILAIHAGVCVEVGVSPLYALTEPVGALIFCWMLVRSAAVTLSNGGVGMARDVLPVGGVEAGVGVKIGIAKRERLVLGFQISNA